MDTKQQDLTLHEVLSVAIDKRRRNPLREALCFVRTLLFEIYVLIVSVMLGGVILGYLRWTRNPKEVRWFLRFWSRSFIAGARYILGTRYRIVGAENIPDRPVIFVGNHQSYWESIAMTAFVPDINVVTKRAAMSIPVFGWGLRHAPMTPVDRDMPGKNIRRMAREIRKSVAEGRSMLIFPEGGRVDPGRVRRYERGIEMVYREGVAPIVPFVTNAGLFWPKGFAIKRPGEITVRFLPSIAEGKNPRKFARELEGLLNFEKERLNVLH
jgi:1-acyl-sn-glycerol-3-phosphate acyltransferase